MLQTAHGPQEFQLRFGVVRGRQAVRIHDGRFKSLRLQPDQMAFLFGETENLLLDRRAVPRPLALPAVSGEGGQFPAVGVTDGVGFLVCVCRRAAEKARLVGNEVPRVDVQEAQRNRGSVGGLRGQPRPIDAVAV